MVTDMHRNVVAAFTVKHECITYLGKQTHRQYLMVQSARDGHPINHHESQFHKATDWYDRHK